MKNSYRSFARLLKNNGYSLDRIRGSHFIFTNGVKTVTINKDLNDMVAKRLIKENNLCLV